MFLIIRKKILRRRRTRNFTIKKRRRFKVSKKHAEKFFNSRLKKFLYYYKRSMKTHNSIENNYFKNQITLNYKFGIQGVNKKYIKIHSMIALIKMIKIYRRITKLNKELQFKVSTYPNFWLTMKPKAVRMGKGKAPLSYVVDVFHKGNIFIQWKLMKKTQHKIKSNKLLQIKLLINISQLARQLNVRAQTKNIIKFNYW